MALEAFLFEEALQALSCTLSSLNKASGPTQQLYTVKLITTQLKGFDTHEIALVIPIFGAFYMTKFDK